MKIPIRRVRLPTADSVYPYLQQIDENRWYSNRGPLLQEFERRLAASFNVHRNAVAVVNSATTGLAASLMTLDQPAGSYCIMPALTFAACPSAALQAGLLPLFADVDPDTLMLTPESIQPALEAVSDISRIGAVMPVSLYGAVMDTDAWLSFREQTRIPVVMDTAWCFDTQIPSELPSVISLHATKAMGVGEGGIITSTDHQFISRIRETTNFALDASRLVAGNGMNGKMSEHGAAVGLAALDDWADHRKAVTETAKTYSALLDPIDEVQIMNRTGADWAPATLLVKFSEPVANEVAKELANRGIEARHWWGTLCSEHPPYKEYAPVDLSVSRHAVDSMLNLPFYVDLERTEIEAITGALKDAFSRMGAARAPKQR